ncbi:phage tail protein I [Shinella sp.]|uniref:phage tail protein I n=1 Tax=Shinella sp. TaxID=1870904 RepID=UPI00299FEA32|nr:phage tail protein I [Shinella sp.]MDX3977173.1 phage tail protein I [Shinella sp.]
MTNPLPLALHLLPLHSSPTPQRAAAALGAMAGDLDDPIAKMADANAIPAAALPHLAWSWSTDYWRDEWPEHRKRQVTLEQPAFHWMKGSIPADRMACAYADAVLISYHLPRDGFMIGRSPTREDHERWLNSLPEIRIYPLPPRTTRTPPLAGAIGRHPVFGGPAMQQAKGTSISGMALPIVEIGPNDLYGEDAFRLRGCARGKYGSIRAYWHDPATASRKKVEEKDGDGPVYEIPELFQDEAEAQAAVKGQRNNSDREEEKLSLTVVGKETRQAEAKLNVSRIDRDADGEWSIDSITHNFIGSTIYTNNIEAVRKEKK